MSNQDKEDWYDTEIAPALREINKKCAEKGMSFVAVVEWNPGKHGLTYSMVPGRSVAMDMLYLCAKCGDNVDRYMLLLRQYAEKKDIDFSGSYFLQLLNK